MSRPLEINSEFSVRIPILPMLFSRTIQRTLGTDVARWLAALEDIAHQVDDIR
jgi:hypothetical protein